MTEQTGDPIDPATIQSQRDLSTALGLLLKARHNLRALEADTGLSRTTLSELRSGRRRVSREALTKVVGRYDSGRVDDWLAAWERVNDGDTKPANATTRTPDVAVTPTEPDTSREPRRRLSYRSLVTLISVIALVEAAVFAGYWWNHRDDSRQPTETALKGSLAASSSCVTSALTYRPGVTALAGAQATGIRVGSVGYFLRPGADPPRVQFAVQLTRPVPEGKHLYLVGHADPTTHDSTPDHHPGNGKYYVTTETSVDGLCVRVPELDFGYGDFAGVTVRIFVMMVDKSQMTAFVRANTDEIDGWTQEALDAFHPTELAFFDVGTMDAP